MWDKCCAFHEPVPRPEEYSYEYRTSLARKVVPQLLVPLARPDVSARPARRRGVDLCLWTREPDGHQHPHVFLFLSHCNDLVRLSGQGGRQGTGKALATRLCF